MSAPRSQVARARHILDAIERKADVVALVVSGDATWTALDAVRKAWGDDVLIISDRVSIEQLDEAQMAELGWVRSDVPRGTDEPS